MHRRPAVVVVSIGVAVGAALVAGAVASGSSTPPDSGPDATTTTVTWPTVPPFFAGPTTTVDPLAPTTTTTLSPAAQTPPVTLVPLGPEATDVVNALYEAHVVFVEAQMDPNAPGLDERIAVVYAPDSPALDHLELLRQQLRDEGMRVYLAAEPWTLTIERIDFYQDPFLRAEVTVCFTDPLVLYEPGGGPDGSDIVVNDKVYSQRARLSVIPGDSAWKYWEGTSLSPRVEGVRNCPAE